MTTRQHERHGVFRFSSVPARDLLWSQDAESGEPGHVVGIVFNALNVQGDLRTTFEAG